MNTSARFAGAIHTQYRFPIAPGVEVHPGRFYGFNAQGQLVAPETAAAGRKVVYAQVRATGDAAATVTALCAVSVVAVVPRGTLTAANIGQRVYAASEVAVTLTDNGKPVGWLLGFDGNQAAIQLG